MSDWFLIELDRIRASSGTRKPTMRGNGNGAKRGWCFNLHTVQKIDSYTVLVYYSRPVRSAVYFESFYLSVLSYVQIVSGLVHTPCQLR